MKRTWTMAALLTLLPALAACQASGPDSSEPEWLTGNIEMTTVDVSFPTPGRVVELLPQEGDRVRPGDLLGRLDSDQLEATRRQNLAQQESIQARIAETDSLIAFQQESYQSGLARAEAQRRQAAAALAELENGTREEEIAQAEAQLREAQTALQLAEQEQKRYTELYRTGDISRQQQEKTESAAAQAKARVEQMEERLRQLRQGPRVERIEGARAAVAAADAALGQARAGAHEVNRSRKLRESLQAQLAALQADQARIEAAFSDLTANSPIDGIVLTRNSEPGEVVPAGRAVLRLADVNKPWIRAYLPESEIGRIQLGAAAEVRTDSFPGKIYTGRVAFIAEEAEFTPKQIQTQEQRVRWVYRIKIQVENPAGELKLNMPCDVRILTQERS